MKPGDVHNSKRCKGKAIVLGVGAWAKRRGRQLHIDMTGPKDFATAATNDPKPERYHRTLF